MMDTSIVWLFCILVFNYNVESLSRSNPIEVETTIGRIRGYKATDGDYNSFKGIPFGVIDESNHFATSTPYPPFNGTFEAIDDTSRCFQSSGGELDCLHLSIFAPTKASPTNRLPVLVWIYGGAFQTGAFGSSIYGPKFLVSHDILLVTLNYRVGVYGFMCLDIPEVSGNQGLKDQRLGLRWLKDNIEAFGGDVNRMTLAGMSAGSKSVDFHLHITKEIPFQGYILHSGTVLLPHLETEPDFDAPLKMARILGFETTDKRAAIKYLTEAGRQRVLSAAGQLKRFEPCYEMEFENVESFLTDYSINLDASNVKDKNVMLGFAEEEWWSRHHSMTDAGYQNWSGFHGELSYYFNFEDEEELNNMVGMMRRFYIGDEPIGQNLRSELSAFDSDFLFNYPTERSIMKYLENGVSKIFYFVFTYVGNRNWVRVRANINTGGATHGDEQGYMFDIQQLGDIQTPADQLVTDRMVTMWANFVKYGNPTPQTSLLLPVKWEPITGSVDSPRYYMEIDANLTLKRKPFNDRFSFWKLFYKLNEKKQRGYKPTPDRR